jgi:sirohydrochlorin ferrochelatase
MLQRGPYRVVEVSYLELAPPSIPDGGRACVAKGAKRVLMLPYFLSAGRHVTTDLERFRAELSQEFPDVEFRLCAPLGLHPKIVDVVVDRLREAESP